jgi:hypothetical protein
MMVIFTASTDLMSAEHTSRFIGPFLRWLIPEISAAGVLAVQLFVRKAAHVTEYAILAALLLRALQGGEARQVLRSVVAALLLAAIYAALDEFHQSFVVSRTASPIDVMIDICGAIFGLTVYWLFSQRTAFATSGHARSERA